MILFKKNTNHYKKYLSTAYIFCFVGMAFHVSVLGPTLPALAQIYGQTEVTGLSLALIGKSIGGFGGVLSMGKVLATYPKHANIIMFFLSVLAGIFTILIPNFSFGAKGPVGVILFSIVLFFQGFFQQMWDVGGNILLTGAWPNKKLLMPWMNLLHFSWGVGATICPLLAAGVGLQANNLPLLYFIIFIIGIIATAPLLFFESPLVDDERQEQNNKDTNVAVNIVDTSIVETTTATNHKHLSRQIDDHNKTNDNDDLNSEAIDLKTSSLEKDAELTDNIVSDNKKQMLQRGLIAMFLYYFSYAGIEGTFGSWLASYVYITGNTIEDGAFAVSILWGSLTLGRLIASIVSKLHQVTPIRLIAVDILLGFISVIIMLIVASTKVLFMLYFSSALIGLSLASMYPMGVTLASERLSDDSQFTSRYISGASFGQLIWPPLVGLLISNNPIAMPVVGLVLLGVCSISFIGIVYFIPPLKEKS